MAYRQNHNGAPFERNETGQEMRSDTIFQSC